MAAEGAITKSPNRNAPLAVQYFPSIGLGGVSMAFQSSSAVHWTVLVEYHPHPGLFFNDRAEFGLHTWMCILPILIADIFSVQLTCLLNYFDVHLTFVFLKKKMME